MGVEGRTVVHCGGGWSCSALWVWEPWVPAAVAVGASWLVVAWLVSEEGTTGEEAPGMAAGHCPLLLELPVLCRGSFLCQGRKCRGGDDGRRVLLAEHRDS